MAAPNPSIVCLMVPVDVVGVDEATGDGLWVGVAEPVGAPDAVGVAAGVGVAVAAAVDVAGAVGRTVAVGDGLAACFAPPQPARAAVRPSATQRLESIHSGSET